MALFRRSTIFHAEEALPDPEELKHRFRRRVLLFTFLGFLLVLGTPVARDLRADLNARAEARRFAEQMLTARTLATASRLPVSMRFIPESQAWQRSLHSLGDSCTTEVYGPSSLIPLEGSWKLLAQQENGTALTGQVLCWHPTRGLLLDATPLGEGKLLVSLMARDDANPDHKLASVLVTQAGAEFQTISY